MKNQRLRTAALIIVGLAYCIAEAGGLGDLLIFLRAAGDLDGVTDIYSTPYLGGYHYYYSVLFALLLKPLYQLPYFGVKFCWLVLNLFLFVLLFRRMLLCEAVKSLSLRQKQIFGGSVFLFSFRFLHENIHASQVTILILFLSVSGLIRIFENKTFSGSLLLAAGINIKLLPLVFLPYLLYRGKVKAFGLTLAFYFAALFLPVLFLGYDYNAFLLTKWYNLVNPANTQHILDVDERSFHSLSTLLSTLLVENVPDPHALDLKRNIANISLPQLSVVLLAARGVLALLTLYFLRWPPFSDRVSLRQRMAEVSYILLVIPLIFPHQQHYAFLFSVPAFAYVLFMVVSNYYEMTKAKRMILLSALSVIYLCGNLRSVLGEFNYYYEHFKILTYGALLLIPCLMWAAAVQRNISGVAQKGNVPEA